MDYSQSELSLLPNHCINFTSLVRLEQMNDDDVILHYPIEWEAEYRLNRIVARWLEDFPEVFDEKNGWFQKFGSAGSLETFNDYALMYLLRKQGVHSVYYYELAGPTSKSRNDDRRLRRHAVIRQWMGEDQFDRLQAALRGVGLSGFTGEPDLFCWRPESGEWFFAEAKARTERYTKWQPLWFKTCRETIPNSIITTFRLLRHTHPS